MLNICRIGCVVLMAIIISLGLTHVIEAGACWLERMDNGKCKELYTKNVSKEECCSSDQEFAYTEKEMSDAEYFFTTAIGGGTFCTSCLDSCEFAKCGPEKRCLLRKGKPKCICAPNCKSSKEKNLKKRLKNVTDITTNEELGQIIPGILLSRKILSLSEEEQSQLSKETTTSMLSQNKKSQRKLIPNRKEKYKKHNLYLRSVKNEQASKQEISHMTNENVTTNLISCSNTNKCGNYNKRKKIPRGNSNVEIFRRNYISNRNEHYSRHQYKKNRKIKQRGKNGHNGENFGRQEILQAQSGITLDEKIRNGFFIHGFPYQPNNLTKKMTSDQYFNPVCGTDGKTYKTECQLRKRACRQESISLAVAYRGQCQTSCKLVRCLNGLTCVEDQYAIPHCISCTITCPKEEVSSAIDLAKAVCGVDGRTYESLCNINSMICMTGRSIAVAYNGPCQEKANCNLIHCGNRRVCLMDLMTNKPRCVSCSFKCPRKRRLQGQRYEDVKVCGNNNHTYQSWCQMRRDSCNTEFYIDIKHVGPCHKNSFTSDLS